MYKKSIYLATYCLLSFLVMGLSHAEEKSAAEDKTEITDLRLILAGNTVEGTIVKTHTKYKMYFHPSGKLARLVDKGNVEKGEWRIRNKTDICLKFTAEKCHTSKQKGGGQFDLYDLHGELVLTINKVIIGNPDRLDALTIKK